MNSKLDLVVVIPESEEGRRSFDRLVKAAEDLFSQQGYRSTTIKDIAQSAGLSVGAFYIYFRSKYQIYVYIMQSFALRLQNYLDSRAGKITGDLIERQVEYIMEFIGFAYKNPACYNLIFESLYIDRDLFPAILLPVRPAICACADQKPRPARRNGPYALVLHQHGHRQFHRPEGAGRKRRRPRADGKDTPNSAHPSAFRIVKSRGGVNLTPVRPLLVVNLSLSRSWPIPSNDR